MKIHITIDVNSPAKIPFQIFYESNSMMEILWPEAKFKENCIVDKDERTTLSCGKVVAAR